MFCAAQTSDSLATKKSFKERDWEFIPQGRVYAFYPVYFGDNALAEAYDAKPAFGLGISFIRYKNIRFHIGGERTILKVSDHQLIGHDIEHSTYTSLYAALSYKLELGKAVSIAPELGIGTGIFQLKQGHERYGTQDVTDFRVGISSNFRIVEYLSGSVGLHYVHSNFDVQTSSEYHDFFSKSNLLQLRIGLVIN